MRELKVYCDHCGKLFREKENSIRLSWFEDFDADLCYPCAKEIVDFVYDFFHIKERENARNAD